MRESGTADLSLSSWISGPLPRVVLPIVPGWRPPSARQLSDYFPMPASAHFLFLRRNLGRDRESAGSNYTPTNYQRIIMHIIGIIVIGLIVGAIAKLLLPGDDPGGFIITTILGIAGAMLAHFLGTKLGWYSEGEPAGFIASVVGAILLLLAYRVLFRRRRT